MKSLISIKLLSKKDYGISLGYLKNILIEANALFGMTKDIEELELLWKVYYLTL